MKQPRAACLFLLSLVLPSLALLSACAARDTVPAAATELYRLETGLYWQYRVIHGQESNTVENNIVGSQRIGNITWFESVEYGERFWIRNTPAGQIEAVNLYTQKDTAAIFEQLDAKALHEELMFKFPATAGDSWTTLENTIHYEGLRSISVPAGNFHCHQYSISQYGQTYSHSCIAEGVGVVYSDNLAPDGVLEVSELVAWGKK